MIGYLQDTEYVSYMLRLATSDRIASVPSIRYSIANTLPSFVEVGQDGSSKHADTGTIEKEYLLHLEINCVECVTSSS
jgi:hypothetical protein